MAFSSKLRLILSSFTFILICCLLPSGRAAGEPFGEGVFGADVPYGSETSLAISTSGNVAIDITPTDSGTLGTANNTVTVTSTDVVGYQLYINSLSSTNMTNGSSSIPASSNGTETPLSTNTWGYNTDGSNNFLGMTTSQALIKTGTGPFVSGDNTTVTYGVLVDNTEPAGDYTTNVVYTAVPQTE
jgi:hypothetical protein